MLYHFLLAPTLLLLLTAQILSTGDCWKVPQKQRHKREWIVPSKKIIENVDYSNEPFVSRMRSDLDEKVPLRYTLRGPGADEPPVGQFIVNEFKGFVRVIRPLDREERENYTLIGTAWFFNNTIAEDNIKVNIAVEDQNDNPPVFNKPERSRVYEGCAVGTFVTQVVAKDADKAYTRHSEIAYTLIKQEPNDGQLFFAVDKDNGTISVNNPSLDREEHSFYVLTVQAADMYGSAGGNSATASLTIDILDVNDNIPTLEKDEFSASIDENVAPIEVLRIQALDHDEDWTDNWLAVFEIVSGNEDGRFAIETDPKTNMGILYLNKPADFESASDMNLNLAVKNKAYPGAPLGSGSGASGQSGASGASGQSGAFGGSGQSGASGGSGQSGTSGGSGQSGASGGSGQSGTFGGSGQTVFFSSVSKQKPYSVKISVKNKPEPPKFRPKVKPISVSENTKGSISKVIDIYPAVEEGTGKPAENVKYAKGYDPDNWISINPDTAEIKLNKLPDRESPYVVNGTYYAKILSITNEPHPQTSTGTIALQVEDLNDNCPKLLGNVQTVCSDTKVVNVTAEDSDSYPNGAPLKFNLIQEKTKGKWNLQTINDASASLLSQEDLWPGFYQVTMEISDMQGLACPDEQVLNLEVCTCSEGTVCGAKMAAAAAGGHTTSATFGAPGITFLFLGFICLILLLMVVIKCECGSAGIGFTDIPFETKQHIISYSIEGIGEDRDVPLLRTQPIHNNGWDDKIIKTRKPSGIVEAMNYKTPMDEIHVQQSNQLYNGSKMVGAMQEGAFGGFYCDTDEADKENSASCQGEHDVVFGVFLKEYYTQKSRFLEKHASPEEMLKKFDYEGEGSVAGSFDNCSFNESNDDLEFLNNNLGFKFNTLAEVCGFRQTQSMSQADPQVIGSSVETTPTTTEFTAVSSDHMTNTVQPSTTPTTTAFTAVSSDHMTDTVQPSPVEITVKSPLVQPTPSHGMVIQEPMYFRFEQPMQSNVFLSEGGHGQGFYIINGTPEADVFLTQGNGHAHLGSGQQGIIGDSVLCSQIGHVGSVVSGESGQGRVIRVGSLGSNHPMSPQPLYQVSSPEWSRPVHINQRVIDGSFSSAQNDGQGTVTILESLVDGGNVLVGDSETVVRMPQIANGQVNGQRLLSPPFSNALNFASGEGVVNRLLVAGPPIAEGHVNGGNLLVAEPGQYPVSMSAGTTSLVSLPHISTGQVNNSQLLVSGPFSSVQNIVSGESGQSKPLVNGPIQHPLAMSPGAHSPVGLPQVANRQLFRSAVSRVKSIRSKGHVANGHLNVQE